RRGRADHAVRGELRALVGPLGHRRGERAVGDVDERVGEPERRVRHVGVHEGRRAPRPEGTENTATLSPSTGTAPNRKNGRNLPHRVIVRSTTRPAKMSANASKMRTSRKSVATAAAEMPATSV